MQHDPSAFVIPDDFWVREQVCAALSDRDIGNLFSLLRKYVGVSQTGLMMCTGIAKSEISLIMSRKRRVEQLIRFESIAAGLKMPDSARILLGLAPVSSPESRRRGPDEISRARSARRNIERTIARNGVTSEHLDRVHSEIDQYSHDCTVLPPREMIDCLSDLLEDFIKSTDNIFGDQAIISAFNAAVSQCAALMADELSILGSPGESTRWHTLARHFADESGSVGLRLHVRALAAAVPLYYGSAEETVRLTTEVLSVSEGVATSGTCLASALRAVALAKLGLQKESSVALTETHRLFDAVKHEDRSLSVFGFSERRLAFYSGRTMSYVGELDGAHATFASSLMLFEPEQVGDRLMIKLDRASALVSGGAISEGCQLAAKALQDVPTEHVCALYLSHAQQIVASSPSAHASADELDMTISRLRELAT